MPDQINNPDYEQLLSQEELIVDATELICDLLVRQGLTRTELAERLDKSKGFVSQVLSGERNMTLRTLSDLAFVLGHKLTVEAHPVAGSATPTPASGWWRPLQVTTATGPHPLPASWSDRRWAQQAPAGVREAEGTAASTGALLHRARQLTPVP